MLLKDKVAIVTGAARGIGLSCARLMADAGASVALCDIDDHTGNVQAEHIRRTGQHCEYFHMDVTDWQSVQAQTEAVAGRFGRLGRSDNAGADQQRDRANDKKVFHERCLSRLGLRVLNSPYTDLRDPFHRATVT